MSSFYKLAIKEIKKETSQAVSILFQIPEELKDKYQFVAGQYVTLKLTLDGQEIRRAYSICSSPKSGELRIAVKAIKNGFFSKFANEDLKVGSLLDVSMPEGKFVLEPKFEAQKNYVAFVAGSGITPVMSMLQTVLNEEPNSTFVLVYGNKNLDETLFYNQLHELQLQHVGRLFVHYAFSRVHAENQLFGRIDKSAVNFILKNKHAEKQFSKYFLCGPEQMIDSVKASLKEHNVSEKDIKFELFTAPISKNDIQITHEGNTIITVLVDSEEVTFQMSPKLTLLEAALKQGIDAPYSCQGGICSSCIAKITSGTATMKKNSILTDKEIEEGLILTCQAHPISADIFVDYDDV